MIEIRWAPLAVADLEAIRAWYREIDYELAEAIAERILAATRLLREFPAAGAIELYGTRRKRRAARTPYNIFYRVAADHVRILRVLHVARDQRRQ